MIDTSIKQLQLHLHINIAMDHGTLEREDGLRNLECRIRQISNRG